MRFLMRVQLPVEAANDVARRGGLGQTIGRILGETRPEAAYFTEMDGERTAFFVVEVADASDLPRLAEPWFLAFDARVQWHPVMLPEDLQRADPHIQRAVEAYG
jgi:hypothetical protein